MALDLKALVLVAVIWLALVAGCFAETSRDLAPTPSAGVLPQTVQLDGKQNSGSSTSKGSSVPNKKTGAVPVKTAAALGKECTLKISAKGRQYTFNRVIRLDDGEYLVALNDDVLDSFAKAHNTTISWDSRQIVAKRGGTRHTLGVNQKKMPDDLGGRQLDSACQTVGGKLYIPLLAFGDLCGVCISVNADGKTGVANTAITDVRLVADGERQQLVVTAQHPISFKTFSLSKPDRFVIDLNGGALNIVKNNIYHPRLGVIRLAQNSLSPAVTRVVIPMVAGNKIQTPSRSTGNKLVFSIDDQATSIPVPSVKFGEQRLTRCQVEERGSQSVVHLIFSGPVQYEWVRLIAPDYRYFVDLPNVVLAGNKQTLQVRNRGVRSVRVSQHSHSPQAKTRVVLDMQSPQAVDVKAGNDGVSLDIVIGSTTVPPNSTMLRGTGYTSSANSVSAPSSTSPEPIVFYRPTSTNPSGQVRTVCIDPGHGGADSGAFNRTINLAEEDVTLDVSMRLTDLLRRSGWKVVMTRESDRDVSYAGSSDSEELWARAKAANDCGADVFVSLHCNAAANSAAEGTSIHVYKQGDMVLGNVMIGPLISSTGRHNRGVHEDRFYVLAHTNMPAVLVEMAFLTNQEEGRMLADPAFRQRIAEGLAEGLNNYASLYLAGRKVAPVSSTATSKNTGGVAPQITTIGVPQRSTFTPPQTYQERRRQHDSEAVLPQSVL